MKFWNIIVHTKTHEYTVNVVKPLVLVAAVVAAIYCVVSFLGWVFS